MPKRRIGVAVLPEGSARASGAAPTGVSVGARLTGKVERHERFGVFALLFAKAVGPQGTVAAQDIAPEFLRGIEARARREKLGNVRTVLGGEKDEGPSLSDSAFDLKVPEKRQDEMSRLVAAINVAANLGVDLAHAWLDPRVGRQAL